jgi:hypothetical protein
MALTTTPPLIFPLSEKAEWRTDPESITFLKTQHEDRYATKQWIAGRNEPINYSSEILWKPYIAKASGIESLFDIIQRAAQQPRLTAIRGAVVERSVNEKLVNKRYREHPEKAAPDIEDAARFWLMLDIDSKPEPEDFDWLSDPRRAAIWAAKKYLPGSFRNGAFVYQYSSSAGFKPGLRLHFWFWLEEPLTCPEVKRILQRSRVDLSLYNPVQPHYTASPILRGMEDPIAGLREGLVI